MEDRSVRFSLDSKLSLTPLKGVELKVLAAVSCSGCEIMDTSVLNSKTKMAPRGLRVWHPQKTD